MTSKGYVGLALTLVLCAIGCEAEIQAVTHAKACTEAGGEWGALSDGCAGQCDLDACDPSASDGCFCRPGACWNGEECLEEEVVRTGECEDGGGVYRVLPTACGDRCDATLQCEPTMIRDCDCGPTACWDGHSCLALTGQ